MKICFFNKLAPISVLLNIFQKYSLMYCLCFMAIVIKMEVKKRIKDLLQYHKKTGSLILLRIKMLLEKKKNSALLSKIK